MKNKMSLKPKLKSRLTLTRILIYTALGGTTLSIFIYLGLTFFGIIGNSKEAFAAPVTGYSWSATVTVDNSKVSGNNNLIDFPLVISVTDANLKSVTNGGKVESTDGFDIVFSDMNNNQLDHQMESYNPTTGEYVAWVKIPILSAINNTEFKMFYGNSSVATDLSTENMWSSNYEAVWHMNNNPSTDDLNDGAGNYDAQDYGSMNSNDIISGKIGPAIDFDGNNDYYAIKTKKYSTAGSIPTITVSGWFNTTFNNNNWTSNWAFLDFDRSEYFNLFIHGNGKMGFSTRGSGNGSVINDFYVGAAGQYNDGNWHHVTAVYDGTNKYIYMDGVLAGTRNNPHNGTPLGRGVVQRYGFIGEGSEASSFNGGRNNKYYRGKCDEIRLLETVLTADWIATEYDNQNSPSSFYSIVFGADPLPVELTSFDVELVNNSAEITWSTVTEINNDYFTIEKSTDAANYEIVDEVVGAGNSQALINYNYVDDNVIEGVSYYRLKQTDFNGDFEYFPPKSVNSSSEGGTLEISKVVPNPFTNQFYVLIKSESSGSANLSVTSINGAQIESVKLNLNKGETKYSYPKASQLQPGTYIIRVTKDGTSTTYKVIKN